MDNGQVIRMAVVGCGHIGRRHADMISRNAECSLVALCDVKSKAELGLTGLDGVPFFASTGELFKSGIEFDVLHVCTPNGLHAQHALEGLEHHKHVVIEKPMALSVDDCRKIIAKRLTQSKKVFCVTQNRFSPPSIWIKEVLEKNLMGKIFFVQVNCFWNRDERYYTGKDWKGTADLDGGTLFTQYSHFIDMMYWLFGDITNIKATFADFNHDHLTDFEDSGSVIFDFTNGGMGCLNYSTSVWDKNMESSITIIGEKGSVKIGGQYMNEVEYCHIKDYRMPELLPTNAGNDYGTYKGSAANHHFIIRDVVDTLKGRTKKITNAADALKVVDIIERIYALRKLEKLQAKYV